MKLLALAALLLPLLAGEGANSSIVRGIGYSVAGETTIITIEVSGGFNYTTGKLRQPERVFFDIPQARPRIDSRSTYSQEFDNPLVRRVRVAETAPAITRIVLDLSKEADISVSKLSSPAQLRIELRSVSADREKSSMAELTSTDSPGEGSLDSEPHLAQAVPREQPRAGAVAVSKSLLTLSISPASAAPGAAGNGLDISANDSPRSGAPAAT